MSGVAKLRLAGVSKRFSSGGAQDTVAVSDLTLDVRQGEFMVIVGPSGCGKTTVLNLLAGLDAPTAGTVTIDNRAITAPGPDRGLEVFAVGNRRQCGARRIDLANDAAAIGDEDGDEPGIDLVIPIDDTLPFGRAERSVDVVVEGRVVGMHVFRYFYFPRRNPRSFSRALNTWDFEVPSAMPSRSATSL